MQPAGTRKDRSESNHLNDNNNDTSFFEGSKSDNLNRAEKDTRLIRNSFDSINDQQQDQQQGNKNNNHQQQQEQPAALSDNSSSLDINHAPFAEGNGDQNSAHDTNNRSSHHLRHQRTKDIVFLVWAPSSPRAEGLSNAIGCELHELNYKFKRKAYSPIKYPLLFMKSVSLLSRARPRIIICQEPPAFCTAAAMMYRYFRDRNTRIVLDAHTAAFKRPWAYFKRLHKFLLKRAFLVVVTNEELREYVMKQYGVRSFVLPDRIALVKERGENLSSTTIDDPNRKGSGGLATTTTTNTSAATKTTKGAKAVLPHMTNYQNDGGGRPPHANNADTAVTKGEHANKPPIHLGLQSPFRVVVICSFSPDEPIAEVLQAAKILPEVEFYITGDYTHAFRRGGEGILEKIPQNVDLTGYLNRTDYIDLLHRADAIIALTKRDNTMLSGANEAFALSKPLITSGWPSLRKYFGNAAIYVSGNRHTSEEIAEAVVEVTNKKDELAKASEQLKNIRSKEWEERFEDFKAILMQYDNNNNKWLTNQGKTSSSSATS